MRFNPLLDEFPTNFHGYEMNTDFRVGILLTKLFNNPDISDDDKKVSALQLLYDTMPDDVLDAWKGVEWFINVGYNKCTNKLDETPKEKEENDEDKDILTQVEEALKDEEGKDLIFDTEYDEYSDEVLDFDFDASRIYTAFLRTYGVDLSVEKMHFFKFMFMLSDLDTDCSHNRVIEIRQTKLKGKKGEERSQYIRLKKIYGIPTEITDESKKKLAEVGIDDDDLAMFAQF